jgi:hypothetical protein
VVHKRYVNEPLCACLLADIQAAMYVHTRSRHDSPQTGTTDIPLTENGVRMVKGMGPRIVGADSESAVCACAGGACCAACRVRA